MIIPVFLAIGYSFTKYSGIGKPKFSGIENYSRALSDPYFIIAVKNTGILLLVSFVLLEVFNMFESFSVFTSYNSKHYSRYFVGIYS